MSKSGFKHVTGSTNNISPWNATVLASATSDTDPTLLINFDNAKYVFNVTEGFSRTCIQRKVTTNKLRSVFLSRYSTETCNGMPGRPYREDDPNPFISPPLLLQVFFSL